MNAAKPERAHTIQMLTLHEGSSCWGAVTGMKLSQCAAYPTCSESVRVESFVLQTLRFWKNPAWNVKENHPLCRNYCSRWRIIQVYKELLISGFQKSFQTLWLWGGWQGRWGWEKEGKAGKAQRSSRSWVCSRQSCWRLWAAEAPLPLLLLGCFGSGMGFVAFVSRGIVLNRNNQCAQSVVI